VRAFKALADPTRLEMMRLLRTQAGPTCVCDIVDHFDLAQPTISHHLKVLKDAGLLTQSKVGIWSFYAPGDEAAELLAEAELLLA
jgi:ArsR family transcriptional regulator